MIFRIASHIREDSYGTTSSDDSRSMEGTLVNIEECRLILSGEPLYVLPYEFASKAKFDILKLRSKWVRTFLKPTSVMYK